MEAAELVVRITGDIDDIEAKLNRTASAATSMGDRIEHAGRSMTSAGQSMTRGLTVPLAAIGGLAIKSAIDFESAFAGVRKTIDASEEEFAQLEAGIRQMSKTLPASASEISAVAEAAGQLGISKDHILSFSRTMIDLGESTNLTADSAAEAMARIANITQMPQDQFDRLGATVVALGNAGASTEQDIVSMALRIAGAGHQVGLSQAEILSFASALSSVGIEAEAGGSAISRAFIKISMAVAEGGDAVEGFADIAGMSSAAFSKAFKEDAAGAMVTFMEGLGRVKDEGGNVFKVLEDLGMEEIRLRDALLRAAGAGDLFREQIELGSRAWEENTALTEEAERRYATAASQLAMFRNKVTDAAVTLGGAMVPALLKLLDSLEPVGRWLIKGVEWFANLSPGIQAFILGLVALVAIAGPVLMFLGAIVTAVGTLAPVVAAVAGFIFGPIGLIIAAIIAIGVAIYALWRNWDTVWGWIKGAASAAVAWIMDHLGLILGPIGWIVTALLWLWRNWDEVWQAVKDAVLLAAVWVAMKLDDLVSFLAAFPGRAWAAIASFVDRMWDAGYQAMSGLASTISDWLSSLVEWFGEFPGRVVDALSGFLGDLYDLGWDAMQGLWNGLRDRATAVLSWARDMGGRILGAIGDAIGWGSPATEFIAMGEDSMRGLMLGVEAYERKLLAQLAALGTASIEAGAIAFAPVPAPSFPSGATSASASSDPRIAALLEEIAALLKDRKGIEMTFNETVDPMHVAREVSWAIGGGD